MIHFRESGCFQTGSLLGQKWGIWCTHTYLGDGGKVRPRASLRAEAEPATRGLSPLPPYGWSQQMTKNVMDSGDIRASDGTNERSQKERGGKEWEGKGRRKKDKERRMWWAQQGSAQGQWSPPSGLVQGEAAAERQVCSRRACRWGRNRACWPGSWPGAQTRTAGRGVDGRQNPWLAKDTGPGTKFPIKTPSRSGGEERDTQYEGWEQRNLLL